MDLSGRGRILHVEEPRILYSLQQRLLGLPNTKGEMDGSRGKHENGRDTWQAWNTEEVYT